MSAKLEDTKLYPIKLKVDSHISVVTIWYIAVVTQYSIGTTAYVHYPTNSIHAGFVGISNGGTYCFNVSLVIFVVQYFQVRLLYV